MLARLSQKESGTIDILARYLAKIVSRSIAHDRSALERSLQSIISPALSREIEENKEKMVDALYPIIGSMITRYVTQAIKEMMEKINEKIEQGLSVERYKRKLKAKLTGVSESELLLEESSDADIHAIFIIEKETGLLIAEAHSKGSEIDDPHMVASMASAIKDFVNDWISNQDEADSKEVQLLSYGDATLYIESAGSVYLIAFLDAEPDYEQRSEINALFTKLLSKQSHFFQNFDGDNNAPEIEQIEETLQDFLNEKVQYTKRLPSKPKNNKGAKVLLFVLGVGLLAAGGYWAKERFALFRLETQLSHTMGKPLHIEARDDALYVQGHLSSIEEFNRVNTLLKQYAPEQKKIINEVYLSPIAIDTKLKMQAKSMQELSQQLTQSQKDNTSAALTSQVQALKTQMQQLQQDLLNTNEKLRTLTQEKAQTQQRLQNLQELAQVKKRALDKLKATFNNNPDLQQEDGSLDFKSKRLFEAGGATPVQEALDALNEDLTAYIETLMADESIRPYIAKFIIEGYTDTSGNHALNQKLSAQRAEAIKAHILTLPVARQYALSSRIEAKGMAEHDPIRINGIEDKEASRRIKIRFVLDHEKVLQDIQQDLHP